jgi:hypothetical protein
MLQGGRELAGLAQKDPDDAGQTRQFLSFAGWQRAQGLLELRGTGGRAFGLQGEPGHQEQGADVLRLLLEDEAQGGLGRLDLGLALAEEVNRLAGQQPGVPRVFAQAVVECLDGRVDLAVLVETMGAAGHGLHLLAAPLEFLTAAARAWRIRIDRRHDTRSSQGCRRQVLSRSQ